MMTVVREAADLPATLRCVLSIGNFDGVHAGHQAILRETVRRAGELGATPAVMTFDPHPISVLRPGTEPLVLTPLPEKLRLLEQLGIGLVYLARSTPELFDYPAEAFVADVMVGQLGATHLVEGYNFCFGQNRAGTNDLLQQLGPAMGFGLTVIDAVDVTMPAGGEQQVSSSWVRGRLLAGDIAAANAGLLRPYRLIGTVVRGRQLGRTIGFPTANLDSRGQLIPAAGVYAGRCAVAGRTYAAAVSIGRNVTISPDAPPTIEAHLLDFSADLYGQTLGVDLIARVRTMVKFDSVEALRRQIAEDAEQARAAAQDASMAYAILS